jgi:hypothetical protein
MYEIEGLERGWVANFVLCVRTFAVAGKSVRGSVFLAGLPPSLLLLFTLRSQANSTHIRANMAAVDTVKLFGKWFVFVLWQDVNDNVKKLLENIRFNLWTIIVHEIIICGTVHVLMLLFLNCRSYEDVEVSDISLRVCPLPLECPARSQPTHFYNWHLLFGK